MRRDDIDRRRRNPLPVAGAVTKLLSDPNIIGPAQYAIFDEGVEGAKRYISKLGKKRHHNFSPGIQFVVGFPKGGGGSRVQSVVFDKAQWTVAKAKEWLREHAFKAPRVEDQANTLRFRQEEPGGFEDFRYMTPGARNPIANPESLKAKLHALRGEIAKAAQKEYDEWDQDEEGIDEECGSGGICDLVASRVSDVLNRAGIDTTEGGQEGDDHAYIYAYDDNEAYGVDIDPRVYESGGGYSWKKRKGVTIKASDVEIYPVRRGDILGNPMRKNREKFQPKRDYQPRKGYEIVDKKGKIVARVSSRAAADRYVDDYAWMDYKVRKILKNPGEVDDYGVPLPDLTQAEEIARGWHGREPEEVLGFDEAEEYEEVGVKLGDLVEIGVLGASGGDEMGVFDLLKLTFKGDKPILVGDLSRANLDIVGGDQMLEGVKTDKQFAPIGYAYSIVYETDKHHLEGSTGYSEPYEHFFGEEFYKENGLVQEDQEDGEDFFRRVVEADLIEPAVQAGYLPVIVYDTLNEKLRLVGGNYTIEDEGITN